MSRVLLACTAILTVLHLGAAFTHHVLGFDHAKGLVPLFDFNIESNAPTWFSSSLLLVAGLAALAISNRSRDARWQWATVGAAAVFLSFDESAQLHELVSAGLRSTLALGGGFSWTIVAVVSLLPVAVAGALFYRFVRSLPRATATGLLAAGAVYVTGVVGVDTIAAFAHAQESGWVMVTALNTVEELLEMVGIIMLIHVLLTHLLQLRPTGTGVRGASAGA